MIDAGQLERTRQLVETELKEYKSGQGKDNPYPLSGYLNNFFGLFVSGSKSSRDQFQHPEAYLWKTPYGSRYEPSPLAEQTPEEFFAVVDEAARTESLAIKDVEGLFRGAIDAFQSGDDNGYSANMERLNELVLPVYIKLRALGYRHYPDLTG